MTKIIEKIFGYVEKILSPYELWLAVFFLSGLVFFDDVKIFLGVFGIYEEYSEWIKLCFLLLALVFIFKVIKFFWNLIKNIKIVDVSTLDNEEIAILRFFVLNQYQTVGLIAKHPAVVKLVNRNFIRVNIARDDCGIWKYRLTKLGKRKLSSPEFQKNYLDGLSDQEVLNFVNDISDKKHDLNIPHKFNSMSGW